ncbi:hypothetical protein SAMN05428989_3573 [Pseudoxanthomonas sp. GM95]|nr:hypothetical protein SAMN05428989_3573 [Pseudoxanthomonas sp. GM95]
MASWLLLALLALAAGLVLALVAVGIKLLLEKRKR